MTSAHHNADTVNFAPHHDIVPDPKSITKQYKAYESTVADTFKDQIDTAQEALNKAKAANGFFTKKRDFAERRKDIDANYGEKDKKLAQDTEALARDVSKLTQLEKTLATGALKSARKRAEARSADLQQQIDEIASLRDTIQALKDMNINIPQRYEYEDILGLNRIDGLEQHIKELQNQAAHDPHYEELKQRHAGLQALLDEKRTQLEKSRNEKKQNREEWSEKLSALKDDIGLKRKTALKSATDSFNAVASEREEAVNVVRSQAKEDINAEERAYSTYRANIRSARRERRKNVISGIFNAVRKAKDIIVNTISEAFNKKTKGEEANETFLEERKRKIESGSLSGPS